MKAKQILAWGLVLTALGWQSVAAGPLDPLMKPESRALRQGLKAYEKADWNEAIAKFAQARDAAETPGLAEFDMGAAAFQNGDYPTAQRSFEQAARSDALPAGEAAYNLGRTLAEAGQLEPALEAFRSALRENPGHEDARHNYEVVWNQIQNQEEQESEDQDQNQENQDQSEDSENSDQNQQNQDQQQDQDQNQDQQDQEQQDPSEQEQDQQEEQQPEPGEEEPPQDGSEQPQPQPGEEQLLTPEEAERLLNALAAQEKDLIEARLKKGKRKRAEKDW